MKVLMELIGILGLLTIFASMAGLLAWGFKVEQVKRLGTEGGMLPSSKPFALSVTGMLVGAALLAVSRLV